MSQTCMHQETKSPKKIRFFISALNVVLALLVYWLLGFMVDDIGNQPGPSLFALQEKYQSPILIKQKDIFNDQYSTLLQTIERKKKQQTIVQGSINSYRDTINQLLELQKASVQKGTDLSPESQQNLKKVTGFYLDSQHQFQGLNRSITNDSRAAHTLQSQIKEIHLQLVKPLEQAQAEYDAQLIKHNIKMAALQLLLLIPLLLISGYFYKKYRDGLYKSMIMAIGIAVILKITMVLHDHFPSRGFKYILIAALIYITICGLLSMLRMVATPKYNWLIKQYQEAYQKIQCPICQFQIRPGILKFIPMPSNQKEPAMAPLNYLETIEEYTCPSCGEQLFEKCSSCSNLRHSLLLYCDHCGTKKQQPGA